ncbi:MAG TPA: rRNA maturation RNase YbeY [Gemmatimonadetes bacterium]|nr:rRNA maturation RNase YbeY [Gemmatimonadota bacterium]HBD97140.1 rRNA maturation RNase YbeY [Gemmatimonadota bacterium]HIN50328.1 rRNA maturation RNase YbeY [Gemmatimonadota bacterium]
MTVQVNLGVFDGVEEALLEAAVRKALDADGREAELSVTLVDDAEITRLNREYRGKDRPTDVISFSLGSPDQPLGDVYVGAEQARRQAEALAVPLSEELVRLAIHGTLHVLGHDHPDGDDRFSSPMYVLQEQLVGEVLSRS